MSCLRSSVQCFVYVIVLWLGLLSNGLAESFKPISKTLTLQSVEYSFVSTGSALREFLFFDIYHITHFIAPNAVKKLQAGLVGQSDQAAPFHRLMELPETKSFEIEYLRDLSADKVKQVLFDGLKTNTRDKDWPKIESQVEDLMAAITQDIEKGDRLELVWLAGGQVLVIFNKNMLKTLESEIFAKSLWGIWFGQDSVVDRNDLLSILK